jgi:hypothetical protein
MMSRRTVLQGPALGGLLASLAPAAGAGAVAPPGAAPAAQKDADQQAMREVTTAIHDLRDEIKRQEGFWELGAVRDPIRTFLRSAGKFPDFLEVGVDIWQQVYDWHIRYHLAPTVGRTAEGRYTILLMATTIVMRVETQPGFVGVPFDNR